MSEHLPPLSPPDPNALHQQIQQQIRQQIRQKVRRARQQLSSEAQQHSATLLVQQAQHLPELAAAQHIALYLSNDGELDTLPLIEYCQQLGKTLYLPVLHPFTAGYLLFQRYDTNTPMRTNKFGILEPKPDVSAMILPTQLDIIFMPLVAFDATGQRLGMGGGFYDRTLSFVNTPATATASKTPLLVGLAHQCQQVDLVPTAVWDVPLPRVLTPEKLWRFA